MARIVLVPVGQILHDVSQQGGYTLVARRTFDRIWLGLLVAMGLLFASCSSSKHPAEPGLDPSIEVDWDALARLFDDPLFLSLPLGLEDQGAAQALVAAEADLVGGIRARDLEVVLGALSRIRAEREAYGRCPCSIPGDVPLLLAISLFETRGLGYLAHVTTSAAPAAMNPEAAR